MSNYDFRDVTNHPVELMGLKNWFLDVGRRMNALERDLRASKILNQQDIRKEIWDDLHNHYCLPVKVRDGKAEWDDDMLAKILGISL